MTSVKYIGLDVHKESISICVRNSVGKVVMESVIETKASTILQFIDGFQGGTLVVGISDTKEVLGLDADHSSLKKMKPDRDGFEQTLHQIPTVTFALVALNAAVILAAIEECRAQVERRLLCNFGGPHDSTGKRWSISDQG